MSSKATDSKDSDQGQHLKLGNKSGPIKSKAADLECIRQNLAKRSLDAKFDLQGSDYKPIENIGIGAYGVVCSAIHNKSGDRVAIKKIPSVFEALSIAKRTYREIKILKHFKHDNIISIREILIPKQNVKDFKDIYVVFDLMESDLHRIIYSKQELSEEHIRYFLYQILRGLKYIHSANVIHRDLKPSNVLVNGDCHLRIGDFGMARGVFYTPDEPSYYMTQYVATRWYRAPEILLSMLEYGAALDMWSVGCIFAEMMGRKHLFPGKDYISQVKLIVGVLGSPSESVLKNCHHEILKKMIKNFGKREPIPWEKLFPKGSKKSLDLVSKMLVINPADRISVDQALSHRLLNNYHDPTDEPICVPTFNFDFEKEDMDKSCLRSAIMEEIMSFHQPKQPTFSFNAFLRPAPKSEDVVVKGEKTDTDQEVSNQLETDMGCNQEHSKVMNNKTPAIIGSKPSSKVSPVSVETGKLQLAPSADIEMLSAQSTDGRAMETQHPDLHTVTKEITKVETSGLDEKKVVCEKDLKICTDRKAGNTISEDTKALVKQALMKMNATQRRQRAESQGDESKDSKPITAAQRQKEREERRRKKKERALEKVKKSKEKKRIQEPPSLALSNEDKELLRRWTVMQNPNHGSNVSQSPPHPGPAVSPPQVTSAATNNKSSASSSNSHNCEANITSQPNACGSHIPSIGSKPRQILAKTSPPSSLTLGSSVNITPSQISTAGTVLFPSTQLNLSQSNFIPVIAIPSAVNPGHLEIKRIFQPTNITTQIPVTSVPSSLQTSENAKSVLHTAILMRNHSTSNTDISTINMQNVVQKGTSSEVENFNPTLNTHVGFSNIHTSVASNEATSQTNIAACDHFTPATVTGTNILKSESSVTSDNDKLSPYSQGNDLLEFLNQHLQNSPTEKSIPGAPNKASPQSHYLDQSQCMQDHQFMLAGQQSENNQHHSLTPPPPYNNYSQTCSSQEQLARSNSTPSLLRQNSHSPNLGSQQQELKQRSSVPVNMFRDHPFSNFTFQSEFTPDFQSTEANQHVNYSQPSRDYQSDFVAMNNYTDYSQTTPVINFDSQITHAGMLFQNSEYSLQLQQQQLCHQVFENVEPYDEFDSFSSSNMARPSSSMQYHHSFSGYSHSACQQQRFSTNQSFHTGSYEGSTNNHTHIITQQTPEPSFSHASIHSTTVASSGSFTTSLLQQGTSTLSSQLGMSHPGHRLRVNCNSLQRVSDSNTESIALLTKQLSKQHMDIVPSLALTPRGTGAGYGVGMDLDAMLTDAQDNAGIRTEQSPLSSSLLADWLDVSENISQADLEAFERELAFQSPMHVSYDGNM